METVAVLGTGRMGTGLASNLARIGCPVRIGSRDEARAAEAADSLKKLFPDAKVAGAGYSDAASSAHIVILSVPFGEVGSLLLQLESEMEGKIIVDITNPFGAAPEGMSGAEVHAPLLPPNASLVA